MCHRKADLAKKNKTCLQNIRGALMRDQNYVHQIDIQGTKSQLNMCVEEQFHLKLKSQIARLRTHGSNLNEQVSLLHCMGN